MAIGQAQGLNVRFSPHDWSNLINPKVAEEAVAPRGGVDDLMFPSKDSVASVDGLTNQLFSDYAQLNNFYLEMRKRGIDPFAYDWTQEGGGEPRQALLKMMENIRTTANDLKNEQKYREQLQQAEFDNKVQIDPNFDRNTQLFTKNPNAVMSTEPTYAIKQANERLGANTDTQGASDALNDAVYNEANSRIDADLAAGNITEAQAILRKSQIFRNTPTPPVFQPRAEDKVDKYAVDRAQLIKSIKGGIYNQDPNAIGILRQAPGVTDVKVINDGKRLGYQIEYNNGNPTFLDLTAGGAGDGAINSYLNRIEGQVNIPNEKVFQFDTTVPVPESDAPAIMNDVMTKFSSIKNNPQAVDDILPQLKKLATDGKLISDHGKVLDVIVEEPWFSSNRIDIRVQPTNAKGAPVGTPRTIKLKKPEDLTNFLNQNANEIAGAMGSTIKPKGGADANRAEQLKKKFNVQY